ncbi:response regulator transcription factor [Aquihabitans sp. McL0605]|uniref:response regulator transcription factor n=1 Tax=Aquihabitans sp. McL0605 TaxID=3415671 RepID=UPI003CFA907A
MTLRVLVVEDDAEIGRSLRDALVAHGYDAELVATGAEASTRVEESVPDLLLLDVGLPDIDGFTLCRWVREHDASVPIVLLTARDSEIDTVVGLDAGATDYVTKPFSMAVLLARIRAHLRGADGHDPGSAFDVGALHIDPAGYSARVAGEPVALRPRELELLVLLGREAGRVVTRERLLSEVWDVHWDSSSKTLEMHVLALRRKLEAAIEITTVRGVGYRLDPR